MTAFTFHSDPGHAWLAVPLRDVLAVGLTPASFSRYSFRDRLDFLYLEEDCDAPRFIEAYQAQHGALPTLCETHRNTDSPIRRLARLEG